MRKTMMLFLTYIFIGIGLVAAQTRSVTGVVTSAEDGQPVVGASVLVKGTTLGTITDIDGKFQLSNVPSTAKVLQISYIGMKSQEVAIAARVNVKLQPDAEVLDEVVVTGYGVTKKAAFTGAATTIGTDKIENKNDANPIKSLEGAVPGLQMSLGSGQPGAPATIFIRGRNSLNSGTQPLYVVDGVQYFADAQGIRSDEAQTVSPLASLNSNDIESITVLKDATATSIYGARAANGVIVITTKRGSTGKPKVNFSAKVGIETMPIYPHAYHTVNAQQYLEMSKEALLNGAKEKDNAVFPYYNGAYGIGLNYDAEGAEQFFDWYTDNGDGGWLTKYKGTDVDWIKEVTRTGLMQEYGIDISGGGSSANAPQYYLSLNAKSEDAIVVGKDLARYAFRFNLDHAPSKYVKYGVNTSLSYTQTNMGAGGGYFSDPLTMARMMSPLTPVKLPNGEWNWDTNQNGYNPVAQRSEYGDVSLAKQYRALIAPYLQINFNDKFSWMTRASVDAFILDEFGYWSFLQPQGKDMRGMGENSGNYNIQTSITNTLNYIDTFNDKHHLNVLLGQEGVRQNRKNTYLSGSNYAVEVLNDVSTAAVPGSAATYKYDLILASFFGNVQYDFDNKYYLSGSLRYDASSRFGANNRWAPFWSVGAKYRISSESFMESTKNWLTNLTLRASYGTSGNQEVGDGWYASRNLFGFGYNYNNLPGMAHEQFGNPDLKWEKTGKFNVGLDATLFERINLTLDYYHHKTSDMVFAVPVSYTTGLTSYYANIGSLTNTGFEASLNALLIQNRDFKWDVTLNGSFNKNKVTKLSTDDPIEGTFTTTEVGYPIYQFKMKEYAGVDSQTGNPLWYLNETGDETTTNYNKAAKRYLGDPSPKFAGSIGTSLAWKGLDFSVQFNYSMGAKVYGSNLRYDEQVGTSFTQNYNYYVYENHWKQPGDVTDVPKLSTNSKSENKHSSRFLMDGDYFKVRSISLGYTFPKSLMDKTFIRSARVFANAENVYTFTAKNFRGVDPANVTPNGVIWWNFPNPTTVMFGVTLGF